MDPTLVWAFALAAVVLSVAPGPDMLYIIANAAAGGRRAAIVAVMGMETGLAVHTVAAALGLSAALRAVPEALTVIRVVGVAFLIYLAVTSWRASRESRPRPAASQLAGYRSLWRVYAMATATNIANPKIVLFYLAFLPQFLTSGPTAWEPGVQLLALGGLFIVVGVCVEMGVALTAGVLSERVLQHAAVRRRLHRAAALIFGGLAVRLAVDAR